MGNVLFRHCENRDLRYRSLLTVYCAGALVNRGKVGVHVTRIPSASGHFLACCRNFTQCIAIVGHVGHNDQHLHAALESQILCGRKRKPWRDDAFNARVVCKVEEENRPFKSACFFEIAHEELRFGIRDSHCGEYHHERL